MTVNTHITTTPARSPHILLRALYFVFFGLWFSGIWAAIGWVLSVTVIGLPFGLWMLNRLPQVTTLRASDRELIIGPNGRIYERETEQHPFLLRAIYFVVVGWWLSGLWIAAAWALSASVIGLILSFWMIDRVPAIMTLRRG
ncbi:MAG TPA: YccF domain-containing protein [Roseiflexaceae bacterium]|nr:YccF domain-containing protein [Roseiflexaceae bacterium]HMP41469.1 YccF domain-containing protein [Roseiflexaceae bacterium]